MSKKILLFVTILYLTLLVGCRTSTFGVTETDVSTVSYVVSDVGLEGERTHSASSNPSQGRAIVSSEVSSLVNDSSNQTSVENKYEEMISQEREGYEYLLRAPENPENLTRQKIEKIFNIKLPEKYSVLEYDFSVDTLAYDRPMYSIKIGIDAECLEEFLNNDNLKNYFQEEPDVIPWNYVDKSKVSHYYQSCESIIFIDDEKNIVKTSGFLTVLVMNEIDGKVQIWMKY